MAYFYLFTIWMLLAGGGWVVWSRFTRSETARQRLFASAADSPEVAQTDLRQMGLFRRWLYRAGFRGASDPTIFLTATSFSILFGIGAATLFVFAGFQETFVASVQLIPGGTGEVFLPAAYLSPWILGISTACLPWLYVRRARRTRVQEFDQDLPLALDLLSTLSESGLGFDVAISRILDTRLGDRPLGKELRSYQADLLAGRSRIECLRRLAWRVNVSGVTILTSALVQAEQIGMGIAEVLRRQALDMRSRRREKANMFALSLATKRMFPLVICFLPGLFVWTLGPVFIELIQMADAFVRVRDF
ncbi:type II secretion system F family protein [Blastopirellula retiformator]|uniref:Bacterial type II secretion system protein F domain protein n=1 Tax=Blastopirellula retiformator TaxID=2527970 RepID=A0A5C5V9R1_9BACT|nr:type II secretion system F family protein [Blastopirellula retiformator]TWT34617.1 Bacterial type II secretion system protein F domain protein [Blastopirellula retiformator]